MSWVRRWKGKHVVINPNDPSALGVCDDSGFDFNHKDLVKQMEWRGNNLVWTGLMVGKPYLDVPQEQNRPPLVKADPRPVKDARIPQTPTLSTFKKTAQQIAVGNKNLLPNPPAYNDPEYPQVAPYNQLVAKLRTTNWNWEN